MNDIKEIEVHGVVYSIKDEVARDDNKNLQDSLGTLAFKDSASGSYTPSGTISTPNASISSIPKTINMMASIGSLPNWTASVQNDRLSFVWNAGTLPEMEIATINEVTGVTVTEPVFTGDREEIVVE